MRGRRGRRENLPEGALSATKTGRRYSHAPSRFQFCPYGVRREFDVPRNELVTRSAITPPCSPSTRSVSVTALTSFPCEWKPGLGGGIGRRAGLWIPFSNESPSSSLGPGTGESPLTSMINQRKFQYSLENWIYTWNGTALFTRAVPFSVRPSLLSAPASRSAPRRHVLPHNPWRRHAQQPPIRTICAHRPYR